MSETVHTVLEYKGVINRPSDPHTITWLEFVALSCDADRYRWLRDGNAYAPEEESISGGEDLDDLCDEALAQTGESDANPPRE